MTYSIALKGMEITVKTYKNAKNMRLISKQNAIVLTVPYNFDKKIVLKFLAENIDKAIENMQNLQKKQPKNIITQYKTRNHELKLFQTPATVVKCSITDTNINVFYNKKLDVSDANVQNIIRRGITAALKIEASTYIPNRIAILADMHGLKYTNVKINTAHSRWGSCNSKKNINISCYVMMLPDELIDLILLHELAHTVYFNHGPQFHALLNKLTNGKEKELEKKLKEYNHINNYGKSS